MLKTYFREWRIHAGYNQQQMATLLETTASTVSRIERGKRDFTGAYLFKFASVCGCQTPGDPVSRPPDRISIDSQINDLSPEVGAELASRMAQLVAIFRKDSPGDD